MFKKAIVCVDGSEASLKAVEAAKEFFERGVFEKITLVSVVSPSSEAFMPSWDIDRKRSLVDQEKEEKTEYAKKVIDQALAIMGKSDKIGTYIDTGFPGDVIITYAIKNDYDCILVGNRGFGGLKRMFLGSVSTQLVQTAQCPVIVIK